jgi:hypothetical protein
LRDTHDDEQQPSRRLTLRSLSTPSSMSAGICALESTVLRLALAAVA